MASPNEPWTLAGGKKNKPQNTHASSKGKKKAFVENMPRIEPSRKLLSDVLVIGVSCNEHYAALSCGKRIRYLWESRQIMVCINNS